MVLANNGQQRARFYTQQARKRILPYCRYCPGRMRDSGCIKQFHQVGYTKLLDLLTLSLASPKNPSDKWKAADWWWVGALAGRVTLASPTRAEFARMFRVKLIGFYFAINLLCSQLCNTSRKVMSALLWYAVS